MQSFGNDIEANHLKIDPCQQFMPMHKSCSNIDRQSIKSPTTRELNIDLLNLKQVDSEHFAKSEQSSERKTTKASSELDFMFFENYTHDITTQTEMKEDFQKQIKKLLDDQKQSYKNEFKNLNLKAKLDQETI